MQYKKKKVFFFLPDIEAGVSRIIRNIINFSPSDKYSLNVIKHNNLDEKGFEPILEKFNVNEEHTITFDRKDNSYNTFCKMAKYLGPEDIIVCNDGFEIRMAVVLKLKNPLAYIVHGDFPYYYNIAILYQNIIDSYICYSRFIYEKLQSLIQPFNRGKIKFIYYPAAIFSKKPVIKKYSNKLKILFAGFISERKGAHLLFQIYQKLLQKTNCFTLGIIGDGPLFENIKKEFLGCSNVVFYGYQENEFVLEKMKEYDLFLFPSLLEGLPNVLIEALQMKCIPVASDLESGIPDIIEDHKNGLLAKKGNIQSFADNLFDLINDSALLNSLRNYNTDSLKEKFEPYNQSKKYFEDFFSINVNSNKNFDINAGGRLLNKKWAPNFLVRFIRTFIVHPKI